MGKSTPTPWVIVMRGKNDGYGDPTAMPLLIENEHWSIAAVIADVPELDAAANAAFIVKAVNCHEQMLSALQAARLAFKVEYANDGRVLSVAYDSEALRPLVADLDAAIAAAGDA